MAHKIIWKSPAADELVHIHNYIAASSEKYATQTVQKIVHAIENLALFPNMGPVLGELKDPSIRSLNVGSYRVVYKVMPSAIIVAGVFHAARLLPEDLQARFSN
jgi:plasmid stabilization system protein ParE